MVQQQQMSGGVDTTMTKVFVGGLAWETKKEALHDHFHGFGDIVEAVIIADKLTARSKGYGFVTFKDPEAAKKACEDPAPVINGRRANCNIAALGARRPRSSPPPINALHHPGMGMMGAAPRGLCAAPWYYHASATPPPPSPYHHYSAAAVPYYPAAAAAYGYPHNYMADMGYTSPPSKVSQQHRGQFSYPGMVAPNGVMPVYPIYQFHQHHQPQTMGMGAPAQFFVPSATMASVPAIISKPAVIRPAVCLAVKQVTSCS